MALNLNCRCSETKSSITLQFIIIGLLWIGKLNSILLMVNYFLICYVFCGCVSAIYHSKVDMIKFLVTEFWGIMQNNHWFFKSYIDSILCSFELSLNWFSCLCSVKFALKDWRHWITSTTCRIRSVLLNKGMQ